MATGPIRRPPPDVEEEIDQYRGVVSDVFSHHRRVCPENSPEACSCGDPWPCAEESLAAQLLDWVG